MTIKVLKANDFFGLTDLSSKNLSLYTIKSEKACDFLTLNYNQFHALFGSFYFFNT